MRRARTLPLGLAAAAACGAALFSAGAQESASEQADGRLLFAGKCALCHGPGGPGTGTLALRMDPAVAELAKREDLTADYVRLVVREGLGNMPPITRVDVTDTELDAIAAYLAQK